MKRNYRYFNLDLVVKCFAFCVILLMTLLIQPQLSPVFAQNSPGVGGFLDEDGDGFNDLMLDGDGDGVPDAIDPDFRGHRADSSFMHQHMYDQGDSTGMMHRMTNGDFMNMEMHGEPGMYGPGDSTMHGMHGDDGGHYGGGHMGGGGGMDPDSGGMMGPGPGKIDNGAGPQPIEIIRGKSESSNSHQGSTESRK
jgi:hypothetical protein